MAPATHSSRYFDRRLVIYRILKRLIILALIVLMVKYFFCATIVLRTEQMEPTLQNGDRVILLKTPFFKPGAQFFQRRINDCVIFDLPLHPGKTGCLRIAGLPGDSVFVNLGVFSRIGQPAPRSAGKPPHEELLPADYSPRDFMPPYRIPKPGDTIFVNSLDTRDLIFSCSMMRQENSQARYALQSTLYIDDSITNDYFIKDFSLFSGPFNTIPDSLAGDWFFWNRLQAFLVSTTDGTKIDIRFSIQCNNEPVTQYRISKQFYFLLADNWCNGYDSRYFGPIVAAALQGKVIAVLWSFAPDNHRNKVARSRRIGRIIR